MLKTSYILFLATLSIATGLVTYFSTPGESPSYIGSDACRGCHESRASGAVQVEWRSGPHARAFRTLATERSREAIEANPDGIEACLPCHSTISGRPAGPNQSRIQTEGVGCERCHGPGSEYSQSVVMRRSGAMLEYGGSPGSLRECTSCHRTPEEENGPICPLDSGVMVPAVGWGDIGHARDTTLPSTPVWDFSSRTINQSGESRPDRVDTQTGKR